MKEEWNRHVYGSWSGERYPALRQFDDAERADAGGSGAGESDAGAARESSAGRHSADPTPDDEGALDAGPWDAYRLGAGHFEPPASIVEGSVWLIGLAAVLCSIAWARVAVFGLPDWLLSAR